MFQRIRRLRDEWRLPGPARSERRRDADGPPSEDPGVDTVIEAGIQWLGRAQDSSVSADGGVARDYSLLRGWATSYPETTGYIIPTILDYASRKADATERERARRMLDWLASIQLPGGGFQGGRVDSKPVVPVTFNTGQILLGLAAGVREFGEYRDALIRAADWLVANQDDDGCWRNHPTPFAAPGEKAYETHVAWGLFEAERVIAGRGYGDAGLRQVKWALTKQRPNGWMGFCCLTDPALPLTHTLGYALRGILEAYRFGHDKTFLDAGRSLAEGLLDVLAEDGSLPGRVSEDWQSGASWVCLTGNVQIAYCWLLLNRWTGELRFLEAGRRANRYVRRTVRIDGPPEVRGAVKGSFPVNGDYGRYEYLSWAAKFMVDANVFESEIEESTYGVPERPIPHIETQ